MANFVAPIFIVAFFLPFMAAAEWDQHIDYGHLDHVDAIHEEHLELDHLEKEYTTEPPTIESASSIPNPTSNPDGEELVDVLAQGLDYMLSNETESMNHSTAVPTELPTNGTIDSFDIFASDISRDTLSQPSDQHKENVHEAPVLHSAGENVTEKLETIDQVISKEKDCKDKAAKSQFDPHCDIVKNYDVIQHHWSTARNDWSVEFSIKNVLHLMETLNKPIDHYVVRLQKIGQKDKAKVDEVQYTLVPWKENVDKITVDNLQSGQQYVFQVCALTETFQPTFLNNEHFAWPKHALAHRFHLHLDSTEEKEGYRTSGLDRKSSSEMFD